MSANILNFLPTSLPISLRTITTTQRPKRDEDVADNNQFFTFSRIAPATISGEREINYGADISTLVRMIEEGKI